MTTSGVRNHHPQFIGEETEAQRKRLNDFSKDIAHEW